MSIEKLIADHTEALKANTTALELLSSLIGGLKTGGAADTAAAASTTTSKAAASDKPKAEEADPIYWCVPNTEHFGIVYTEAEYKKIKKAHPKAIKTIESKYNALVEAASKNTGSDDDEVNERVQALIDAVPVEPEEADIIAVFTGYLPKALSKDERDARAAIIKPILEGVKAAKATAVKPEDRYDVMVAVIKGIEAHLEETDQVSEEDDMV